MQPTCNGDCGNPWCHVEGGGGGGGRGGGNGGARARLGHKLGARDGQLALSNYLHCCNSRTRPGNGAATHVIKKSEEFLQLSVATHH